MNKETNTTTDPSKLSPLEQADRFTASYRGTQSELVKKLDNLKSTRKDATLAPYYEAHKVAEETLDTVENMELGRIPATQRVGSSEWNSHRDTLTNNMDALWDTIEAYKDVEGPEDKEIVAKLEYGKKVWEQIGGNKVDEEERKIRTLKPDSKHRKVAESYLNKAKVNLARNAMKYAELQSPTEKKMPNDESRDTDDTAESTTSVDGPTLTQALKSEGLLGKTPDEVFPTELVEEQLDKNYESNKKDHEAAQLEAAELIGKFIELLEQDLVDNPPSASTENYDTDEAPISHTDYRLGGIALVGSGLNKIRGNIADRFRNAKQTKSARASFKQSFNSEKKEAAITRLKASSVGGIVGRYIARKKHPKTKEQLAKAYNKNIRKLKAKG